MISSKNVLHSQTLFVDNINYPERDSLELLGGWGQSGGESPYDIEVRSPGLNYAGYLGSGIGNSVLIDCHDDGDVCLHGFSMKTSGSVYTSFLMNVELLSNETTWDSIYAWIHLVDQQIIIRRHT